MAHSVRLPRYKFAAVSLSPSCLEKLRVPDEFAKRLQPGVAEEEREVILVGPLGKVWRVELRLQDGACWLVGGWAELAAAHGIGAGWSVVLRRERRGVATLSAFDPGRCLARLCSPVRGVTCKIRPRFLKLLQPDDMEKMRIPDEFVQQHLTEAGSCLSSQKALILCPLGKVWPVKLDHGQSDVLHGDVWARFLAAHDLSEGSILLFRYEGNMAFSVEVFLPNGCLKEYHTALALCTTDGAMGPTTTMLPQSGNRPVPVTAAAASKKRKNDKQVVYAIAATAPQSKPETVQTKNKPAGIFPRASFTKKITRFSLTGMIHLGGNFCSSIGLLEACTIELKTSVGSPRTWPVAFKLTKTYGYIKGKGWQRFCRDNEVEEGDPYTFRFKVVKRKVWLVMIK